MQRLPLRFLEPGMKIGREVVNDQGLTLAAEGAELDEKLISRLENLKIKRVVVQGCPVALKDLMPKKLSARLEDLETGFSRQRGNPLMEKFRVVVKAHFLRRDRELRGNVALNEEGALQPVQDPNL